MRNLLFFFFQAEDGIRDKLVTGVQTCALPISRFRRKAAENAMKVIGLAGWSGAGKTTLLAGVIPHLLAKGLRVSVIKHAHHAFDVDVPGKDSWIHRQSGAT